MTELSHRSSNERTGYLRWLLRGWRLMYVACRDNTYPVEGCGQWRLQAAWNATGWSWRQWWKYDRRTHGEQGRG